MSFVNTKELIEWECVLFMVLNFCDILDGTKISKVRYDIAVKRSYVSCMMTGEDMVSGQMTYGRSLTDTKMVRRSLLEAPRSKVACVCDDTRSSSKDEESLKRSSRIIFPVVVTFFSRNVYDIGQSKGNEQ